MINFADLNPAALREQAKFLERLADQKRQMADMIDIVFSPPGCVSSLGA